MIMSRGLCHVHKGFESSFPWITERFAAKEVTISWICARRAVATTS